MFFSTDKNLESLILKIISNNFKKNMKNSFNDNISQKILELIYNNV